MTMKADFRHQYRENVESLFNFSAYSWLKAERPKLAIHLHKLDSCDFCLYIKRKVQEKQMTQKKGKKKWKCGIWSFVVARERKGGTFRFLSP